MADNKHDDARGWLARALRLDKLSAAERADYEPRIHGERRTKSAPPATSRERTREHGDGRAAR